MWAVPVARPVRLAVATPTVVEHCPPGGVTRLYHQSPVWLPMVSVAVSSCTALTVNDAPCGVADSDSGDSAPPPLAFTARTLNLYAVPLVRPLTVCDRLDEVLEISVQSAS